MATTGPVIYDAVDFYLDPEHLPSKKNLILRGILNCLPFALVFSWLITFVIILPVASVSVVAAVLCGGVLLIGAPGVFHAMFAIHNRKEFIAAGGNRANYGYWCYAGMLPISLRRGTEYKFANPEDIERFKASPWIEVRTRDWVWF